MLLSISGIIYYTIRELFVDQYQKLKNLSCVKDIYKIHA